MAPGTRSAGNADTADSGSSDLSEEARRVDLSNLIRETIRDQLTAIKDTLVPKPKGTKRKSTIISDDEDSEDGGRDNGGPADRTGGGSHANGQVGHGTDRGQDGDSDDEDPLREYYRTLEEVLEEGEKTSEELPRKVISVFKKAIGQPFENRFVKEKRDLFPRPGNAPTLKPPQLNNALKRATTQNGRLMDKRLVEMQLNMTAAMTAVARQATILDDLKEWAKSKDAGKSLAGKSDILGKMMIMSMDANILLTRAMSDATSLRRDTLKFSLSEKVAGLLSDENPATADWLGGDDLTAAMDKLEKEEKQVSHFKKSYSYADNKGATYNKQAKHQDGYKSKKQKYSKEKSYSGNKKQKKDFHKRGSH